MSVSSQKQVPQDSSVIDGPQQACLQALTMLELYTNWIRAQRTNRVANVSLTTTLAGLSPAKARILGFGMLTPCAWQRDIDVLTCFLTQFRSIQTNSLPNSQASGFQPHTRISRHHVCGLTFDWNSQTEGSWVATQTNRGRSLTLTQTLTERASSTSPTSASHQEL